MAEQNDSTEVPSGGGSKKKMVIVLIILFVGIAGFAAVSLFSDDEDSKKKGKNVKEHVEYNPNAEKKIIKIDLKEFTASMPNPAIGRKDRKRIKMHPYLILKPFYDESTEQFDQEKNKKMEDLYMSAIPILRQEILATVSQMDASIEYESKDMAKTLKDAINQFDSRATDVVSSYNKIFGKRVLEVVFYTYEPR